ncbi:MAG: transketolase family protein [Acidimicrobiia bacterium]
MNDVLHDCRDSFAAALLDVAAADDRVVAVTNDAVGSSKLGEFARSHPARLFNAGIAEQNLIGVAAGLADSGKIPFVAGASCFLTARALEQIKVDIAYSKSNVKICGQSSGVAYGALGTTHHSLEDIAWLRAIPDLAIVVPAGPFETAAAVRHAAEVDGPMFIRISRMAIPEVHAGDHRFTFGKADLLRQGPDVTLIATGTMVHRTLAAADVLRAEGIEATVINLSSIAPLDAEAIAEAAARTGGVVTVEEAYARGGMGSAVAEIVATERPVPMRILGFPSEFAPTGGAEWLLDHYGLNAAGIAAAARSITDGA